MSRRKPPLLVAVSGPDGAGKSSLVGELAPALRRHGFHAVSAYGYGCIVCRRMRPRRPEALSATGRRPLISRIAAMTSRVHALVDAGELAVRIAAARVRVRITGRARPAVILTDRGPLDTLVKFDPLKTSAGAAILGRLAARYDATLLLDAPPEVLAARDGAHSVELLDESRRHYRRWSPRLRSVVLLDSSAEPGAVMADALGSVLKASAAPGPVDWDRRRSHVVLSTYDDAGNPHYHGGGAIVVEKVARRLSKDFRVTVVTASTRGGTCLRDGVRYRYLPLGWAGPRGGQLLFHAVLPFLARRLRHDLWMESFTPPFSTSFLPLFSPARVVGVAQQLSGGAMRQRYRLPFDIVERFGLRFYRDVIALNGADGEIIRHHSSAAVHVIPNGVDRRRIDEERFGRGEHILFLGRIDLHTKGVDLLLSAYARAATPMPLVLAGAGTEAQQRKLAAMLDQQGRGVRWVGHVDGARKQELLDRSAFLVLPSRYESFGVAALEAMASGKPVLHFDLPALAWMLGSGDVAVPPFDVDELANKICELAADERLRARLGRDAHLATEHYSWEETTTRYRSLVRHLLGISAPDATGMARCEPIH